MTAHLDIDKLNDSFEAGNVAFRKMTDELPIGVGIYDVNAKPVDCNPAAHRLLGLTKEQFLGNSVMDPYWKITHKDGTKFETYDFPIIKVITNYEPIFDIVMGVSRPLQHDKVWLEVNTHPILHADRSLKHVICTYKQITE